MTQPQPEPQSGRPAVPWNTANRRPGSPSPSSAPPPPPARGGRWGGGWPPRGLGLPAVMDQVVGSRPGIPLATSGRSVARLAREIRATEPPEPLLAALFWNAAARTRGYQAALRSVGVDPASTRRIVVAHAGNTRHSLLVLAPDLRRPPTRLRLKMTAAEVAGEAAETPGFQRLLSRHPGIPADTAIAAIQEIAAVRPAVVVAPQPAEVATTTTAVTTVGAPAVAMRVAEAASAGAIATVGLVLHRAPTTCLATTAWHALCDADRTFLVAGRPARVVAYAPVTDIGVLEVDEHLCSRSMVGAVGLRRTQMPVAPGERVTFRRAVEGTVPTVVQGVDPGIVDEQTAFATKIYTEPVTRPGDSGVALIDANDCVAGFAAWRTSARSAITYSIWIWARQALDSVKEQL